MNHNTLLNICDQSRAGGLQIHLDIYIYKYVPFAFATRALKYPFALLSEGYRVLYDHQGVSLIYMVCTALVFFYSFRYVFLQLGIFCFNLFPVSKSRQQVPLASQVCFVSTCFQLASPVSKFRQEVPSKKYRVLEACSIGLPKKNRICGFRERIFRNFH